MKEVKEKLELELSQLNEKINKLQRAFDKEDFCNKVGLEQYELLQNQLYAMRIYSNILNKRISLLN